MADTLSTSFELSKQSWAALRHNRQLFIFPVISTFVMLALILLFFIPLAGTGIFQNVTAGQPLSTQQKVLGVVLFFLLYLVGYIVVIFSNTALIGATLKLLRGEQATAGDGFRIALSRLGPIIGFALLSATVGLLARGISQAGRNSENAQLAIVAALIGGLIAASWDLATFFVIPVIVVEPVGTLTAIKHSWALFKQTWGEAVTGKATIGGISCLLILGVLVVGGGLIFVAFVSESVVFISIAIVLATLALTMIYLLTGAVNGIFQVSLYQFATTGSAGSFIDSALAHNAFQPKPAKITPSVEESDFNSTPHP